MKFTQTILEGAYIIEAEKMMDDRGFFARSWCQRELAAHGLASRIAQASISFNKSKGTLRGLHYQSAPHEEAKFVRCTRGAIYDVIIDLRAHSPTFKAWVGVELTADSYHILYVPKGFAHGCQTLEDNTEIQYEISEFYTPAAVRGVRYDDPAFGISWPLPVSAITDKDMSWPNFAG
jgi:dTDP-4-dehydrorhamnose 3,5-epimerase